ncbi:MAG: aminotransferase class IV, partial [Pseudomonadales bacterium]
MNTNIQRFAAMVNGRWQDHVSVNDRGMMYGDGLFETIRVVRGKCQLLDLHLQRLRVGLQVLNISCSMPRLEKWLCDYLELLQQTERAVLKIIVTRGHSARGYAPARPGETGVAAEPSVI